MRYLYLSAAFIFFIAFMQGNPLYPLEHHFDLGLNAADDSTSPGNCPPSVDYAGRKYKTVQIGTQCWFMENLSIGKMINSSLDPSDSSEIEMYCYNNRVNNCEKYGALYQWSEAMQYRSAAPDRQKHTLNSRQGICPDGWHIPSLEDYRTLDSLVNGEADKLKAPGGVIGASGDNSSGFTALVKGYRDTDGTFKGMAYRTLFWSSDEYSDIKASNFYLQSRENTIQYFVNRKTYGFHIRCIKD